jgi:hypothetical protein
MVRQGGQVTPTYEVVVGNIGTVYRGESVLDSMADER